MVVKIEKSFRKDSPAGATLRRPLLVGNWKMNGGRAQLAELAAIDAAAGEGPETVLCVPAPLIALAAAQAAHVGIGAQDCHAEPGGAFTGGISAALLADAGADWVLVGHSECRRGGALANADVARKLAAALPLLRAILCVGEVERSAVPASVADELLESLPAACDPARLTIAYEPVWAIGSGATPSPERIEAVHACLRDALAERFGGEGAQVRILYGGSVTGANAGEIAAIGNVDGLLVGGASLTARAFVPIVEHIKREQGRRM